MKSYGSVIALFALILLPAPALNAQADVFSNTFVNFDEDTFDMFGYSAMIATYDVQFYYAATMETTMLVQGGKVLDVASFNSGDDEYLIAEVGANGVPGATIRVSARTGLAPYYRNRNLQSYDVFNFQYWTARAITRRNYAHFMGKGPAKFITTKDEDWPSDAVKPPPGVLAIDIRNGKSWRTGGSVVLDKWPTTATTLTAKGMTETGKFRWTVGPKLKIIGSAKGPKICVYGLKRSEKDGDATVSLVFTSRTGKKQTAQIPFTIRAPISLTRFGIQ